MNMPRARVRSLSRAEQLTHATARNCRDLSTADLMARAMLMASAIHDSEEEILRLRSELAKYTARVTADRAELLGLERILESRR